MKFDFLSESDQAYFIHKASTLVEALPYIRQHSGDIIVINAKLIQSKSEVHKFTADCKVGEDIVCKADLIGAIRPKNDTWICDNRSVSENCR